jgi:hypothetical protein
LEPALVTLAHKGSRAHFPRPWCKRGKYSTRSDRRLLPLGSHARRFTRALASKQHQSNTGGKTLPSSGPLPRVSKAKTWAKP